MVTHSHPAPKPAQDRSATKRDPITSYRAPFAFDEVVDELRLARWCSASMAALEGGEEDGRRMLGFDAEFGPNESFGHYADRIEVGHLPIRETFRRAYAFAFQTEGRGTFDEDDWMDLAAYTAGAARRDWEGRRSPLALPESRLLHTADMALARMNLLHGNALTIRHLALLANMTEPAVRSALSLEGIRTEGRPASLPADLAERWLAGRRGFVPTADSGADGYRDRARERALDLPLAEAMARLMAEAGMDPGALAAAADIPRQHLARLMDGRPEDIGLGTLARVARALAVEPAVFVAACARAVG